MYFFFFFFFFGGGGGGGVLTELSIQSVLYSYTFAHNLMKMFLYVDSESTITALLNRSIHIFQKRLMTIF